MSPSTLQTLYDFLIIIHSDCTVHASPGRDGRLQVREVSQPGWKGAQLEEQRHQVRKVKSVTHRQQWELMLVQRSSNDPAFVAFCLQPAFQLPFSFVSFQAHDGKQVQRHVCAEDDRWALKGWLCFQPVSPRRLEGQVHVQKFEQSNNRIMKQLNLTQNLGL